VPADLTGLMSLAMPFLIVIASPQHGLSSKSILRGRGNLLI